MKPIVRVSDDAVAARRILSLDGAWQFRLEAAASRDPQALPPDPGDGVGWLDVAVPACWDGYRPELDGYRGAGWFRKTFPWKQGGDEVVFLRFEAVNYAAEVWLNGRPVGRHEGAYTPFEFEVTPHLGRDNVLLVRVDNTPLPHRVPQADQCGWRNYGGIHREVCLRSMYAAHVEEFLVEAEPAGPGPDPAQSLHRMPGRLEATVRVRNALSRGFEGILRVAVTDPAGNVVLEREHPCKASAAEQTTIQLCDELGGIEAWSPEHPALYGIEAVLVDSGGVPLDRARMSFGFRSIAVRNGEILLNGRPVFLIGFNRHEQYGDGGPVDPGGMLERDLRDMKDNLGANTVRCSHYPQHPRLYDLCDRIGLMVIDEIPLYYDKGTAGAMTDRRVVASARHQIEEMIRRDRNHPCVVAWSVANETATHLKGGCRTVSSLIALARRLDSRRLVCHVSNKLTLDRCFEHGDIICLNEYPGVFRSTTDIPGWFREVHDTIRSRHPGKPIVITEWGDWGLPGTRGLVRGSEENQAAMLERLGSLIAAMPEVRGMVLWCYADYLWPVERGILDPVKADDWPANLRSFGVMDRFRSPKLAYEVIRRLHRARGQPR